MPHAQLTGRKHLHCISVKMADALEDKGMDVSEGYTNHGRSSNLNLEAGLDDVDIARVEKVYKYVRL